jgi:hypothetical protein
MYCRSLLKRAYPGMESRVSLVGKSQTGGYEQVSYDFLGTRNASQSIYQGAQRGQVPVNGTRNASRILSDLAC